MLLHGKKASFRVRKMGFSGQKWQKSPSETVILGQNLHLESQNLAYLHDFLRGVQELQEFIVHSSQFKVLSEE